MAEGESDGIVREFDVAVSFAGEDRDFVVDVVEGVKAHGFKVFYDDDHQAEMWGEDGIEYLTDVYLNRARYVVFFVSVHYGQKMWTRLERRASLARAMTERRAYVLPVRLDDTELEGLLPTTFYLDARRLGLERIVETIKERLDGYPLSRSSKTLLDGKVPRTQDAIDAMIAERPPGWEYLLYAGVLRAGIEALAGKRRDHDIGYATRTGDYVDGTVLVDHAQAALADARQLVGNFEAVLAASVQEAAFGALGEPGDPDRILHMAERYLSVYEDFMDWAARLRGTAVQGDHARAALRALADTSNANVQELADFVDEFVSEMDTMNDRIDAGEAVEIVRTVKLNLDPELMATFQSELQRAVLEAD